MQQIISDSIWMTRRAASGASGAGSRPGPLRSTGSAVAVREETSGSGDGTEAILYE